jgi:hypothetical protein
MHVVITVDLSLTVASGYLQPEERCGPAALVLIQKELEFCVGKEKSERPFLATWRSNPDFEQEQTYCSPLSG